MRHARLTDEEIEVESRSVPNWDRHSKAIRTRLKFRSFRQCIAFVDKVADAAESADHHPDIDIRYDKVTLELTTHDSGGLTRLDFQLARQIDLVAAEIKE